MKKNSVLHKALAVALSVAMLAGTGFTAVGSYVGTSGISVSAVQVYGDFEYEVNNDNTITITEYTGDGGNVTIPNKIDGKSVTEIGEYAFDSCTGLTSITIPDSVTSIGEGAFYNCKNLTSITISDSVTSIGEGAFSSCTGLTSITIPDSVTSIGDVAFAHCTGLTSIIIPDSVTEIGDWAFYNCKNLTSITIPDSVTEIGDMAFNDCTSLTNVTIPNSVMEIGDYAFRNCTGLTSITIPDSVTEIGYYAFSDCTGLTSVTIGKSVTSIGYMAFNHCTGLISITISKNNTVYSSIDGVLFSKDKSTFMICPQGKQGMYVIPDNVTSIDKYAFSDCTGLTSIMIPESVTSIDKYAFSDCTGLKSITIGNSVTSIGSWAFGGCTGLTSITIPDSVISIGSSAFNGCTGLTSITIPDSITTISYGLFSGCTNLTSITIPDSVTSIGSNAFNGCIGLTIYGAKGSYAETYAKENNIPFVAVLMNQSKISAKEMVLGQSVTVNAKSSEDNCTYAVYYKKKAESKWTTKQDFGTNDTVKIKPASVADYDICVKVKDSKGKVVKKYFDVKVNAKLSNTSTLSAENVILGQQVTVNGLAKGGVGEYQYQVLYKQTSQAKWTTAQAFSENATVTFKPAKTTTYDVCVKVKDSNGTIVKKFFTVQVNAKLTNTSDVSATEIKKGSTVTVNSSATGGVGDYTYAVYYKQKAQTKWTTKQDFNDNADVSIKPAQATDYDICVKVKDKDGTIVKKYFTVTVTK